MMMKFLFLIFGVAIDKGHETENLKEVFEFWFKCTWANEKMSFYLECKTKVVYMYYRTIIYQSKHIVAGKFNKLCF